MSEEFKLRMLANKIEDSMLFKQLTKAQLAELCGVHTSEVYRWLSGKHNFTVRILLRIEEALDIQLLDVYLGVNH